VSTAPDPPLRLTRRGRFVVVLAAVSVVVAAVLMLSGRSSSAGPAAQGAGSPVVPATPSPVADPTPTPRTTATPVPEEAVSQAASGSLAVVSGAQGSADGEGRVVRYRVLVERDLLVDGQPVDRRGFARLVHRILTDDRGWQPIDGVRFARVAGDAADVDVVLASPDTTDALCAPLGTEGWLSCYNGSATVLNARRWFSGAESYGDDLAGYRRYLVSHEMGHYLGYPHVDCPAPGARAPVMVQQTKSLYGCVKGPWPSIA
jgi:hypothetical protein